MIPPDPLGDWNRSQARRDRAQRVESLAFYGLLVAMLVVMVWYLARLDARSAEFNDLLRQQRTEIAATPVP